MLLFDAVTGEPDVLDEGDALPERFSEVEVIVELTVLLIVEVM